jgi:hypothetical protein
MADDKSKARGLKAPKLVQGAIKNERVLFLQVLVCRLRLLSAAC